MSHMSLPQYAPYNPFGNGSGDIPNGPAYCWPSGSPGQCQAGYPYQGYNPFGYNCGWDAYYPLPFSGYSTSRHYGIPYGYGHNNGIAGSWNRTNTNSHNGYNIFNISFNILRDNIIKIIGNLTDISDPAPPDTDDTDTGNSDSG